MSHAQRRKLVLPKPELVTVSTNDGVRVRCAYYPGGVVQSSKKGEFVPKKGKEVVPVILLHGWEGSKSEFAALANILQRRGHAVIVPDLRGHGDSITMRFPNGAEREIDRDRMRPVDIQGMIRDVQAAKKFLLEKNNEGELNIELLCLVGAELGSILAVNFAQLDWSRQQLPSFKQGQDVKALVLLTPRQSFKGMTASRAFKHPMVASRLETLIVVGDNDRKGHSEAKSIHKRLERMRPEQTDPTKQSLVFAELPTSLAGTELVDPNARLNVDRLIAAFIHKRLVLRSSRFAWKERRNPLDVTE